jgi:hypothetical protein
MEGFLIHDLKEQKRSIDINCGWNWVLFYNSDKLVFPIPLREMDTNKLITQNPGYGS